MTYGKLVVDTNNYYHSAYSVASKEFPGPDDGKMRLSKSITIFLSMIRKIERDYLGQFGNIYFIRDNFSSKMNQRKIIDPEYKLNRVRMPQDFYNGINFLMMIIEQYNDRYRTAMLPLYEADDLVLPLVQYFSKSDRVLLCSSDLDWSRLIEYEGRCIHWLDRKKIYDSDTFLEEYEFTPTRHNVVLWKTFRGDRIDNVPVGVKGIPKPILFYLMEYEDVYDIFENLVIMEIPDKWKEKIREAKARLFLNFELVDFEEVSLAELKGAIKNCSFNPHALSLCYNTIGINPVLVDRRVAEYEKKEHDRHHGDDDDFFQNINLPRV